MEPVSVVAERIARNAAIQLKRRGLNKGSYWQGFAKGKKKHDPWSQGWNADPRAAVDVYGAIKIAGQCEPFGFEAERLVRDALVPALTMFHRLRGLPIKHASIAAWNDDPETTASDVISVLESVPMLVK